MYRYVTKRSGYICFCLGSSLPVLYLRSAGKNCPLWYNISVKANNLSNGSFVNVSARVVK